MKYRKTLILSFFAGVGLAANAAELNLTGNWDLTETGKPGAPLRAEVPGGVYAALLEAGRIPDPYYGANELTVQGVSERNWTFSRSFDVSGELSAAKSVTLRLEDVDCFADVVLNGVKLGETVNRFRRWDYDVTKLLRPKGNRLELRFVSTARKSTELAKEYEKTDYLYAKQGGEHRRLVRGVLCRGGWDWGLRLMDVGPMGTVKLITTDVVRLDYAYTTQKFAPDFSSVEVTVTADAHSPAGGRTRFEASLCGRTVGKDVELAPGANRVSVVLKVEKPELWWPREYGKQALHGLRVKLGEATLEKRIGLREVKLVETPDRVIDPDTGKETDGRSFGLTVNGVQVFCKGANWVPCDAIENRQTPERYHELIAAAAAGGMNTIRIWGGGQFEHDAFYDACDETGILVWHDFMFACQIYPVNAHFMDNVRAELAHELRRLRDHASIGLWCGDNECITVAYMYTKVPEEQERNAAWCKARAEQLAAAVAEYDPTHPFWAASPYRGNGDFGRAWQTTGDLHCWSVWFGKTPVKYMYSMAPRFCSEHGFLSLPSQELLSRYIPADELNPNSETMRVHFKCRGAAETLFKFMNDEFTYPESLAEYGYQTQVLQAMATRHAIAAWNSNRPHCGGILFWQLNDNWPVASWSMVEYGGKWKPAQYAAKRGFAPVAVYAAAKFRDPGTFEARAVNDTQEPFAGELVLELHSFSGDVKRLAAQPVTIAPHAGVLLKSWPRSVFGDDAARKRVFAVLTLRGTSGGTEYVSSDDWIFTRMREAAIERAKVGFACAAGPRPGTFAVTLTTDRPAFYVWLNAKDVAGEFDDNSITLLPGRPRTLVFTARDPGLTLERFRQSLAMMHYRR